MLRMPVPVSMTSTSTQLSCSRSTMRTFRLVWGSRAYLRKLDRALSTNSQMISEKRSKFPEMDCHSSRPLGVFSMGKVFRVHIHFIPFRAAWPHVRKTKHRAGHRPTRWEKGMKTLPHRGVPLRRGGKKGILTLWCGRSPLCRWASTCAGAVERYIHCTAAVLFSTVLYSIRLHISTVSFAKYVQPYICNFPI